ETYSETYSHIDTCIPCTMCTGLMRMQTPCTDSNNAICVCDYNYYLNEVSGRCEPCTVCPAGQGVLAHCEHNHDTVCEECIDDTYSDRDSSLDPCLPCTICDEGIEVELSACTPVSDSLCHSKRTNAHSQQHTHTQPARYNVWELMVTFALLSYQGRIVKSCMSLSQCFLSHVNLGCLQG
ncbi:unnamed protein product, partial [Oncorhynchus mykiss]